MRFRLKGFTVRQGCADAAFSAGGLSDRLRRAYRKLHEMAADDMLPYMPSRTGQFREQTRAANTAMIGSGHIYAGVGPMGRYLYRNRVMVDAATGKGPRIIPGVGPRFHKGAKLTATDRRLHYSSRAAREAWFEYAKAKRLKYWIDQMQAIVDGK